ncbi:MAG: glycosyltransferase family 2 protein [Oscillatoriophycideae cyanobacterium NC_groundwater_1537_Pr4_S-0.65um_50_18]|nr:glycosyltransferase family 2 protein [Oscillatoriophycideae cyanobacterium NC_groundwater_1537_Pr4_S-0.65um_50_18]
MKPLVSILIAAYNAEPWIAQTLDSALAQTWTNLEIIVVDDGSTDGSLAIAQRYESQQVKVVTQLNQGASAARNAAYQICTGDYIQYLDADDLLAVDKIEQQVTLLQNFPEMLATCEWGRFHADPTAARFIPQKLWQDLSPVDFLVTAWEGHLMMHPAAWLIPRSVAEKAGLWNEALSLNDDGEYFTRVVLASQGTKFCWGAKSYYRSGNAASLSASKSHAAWKSAFQALESGTSNLLARENSDRTRHTCATLFQRFIYEVYPEVPDLRSQAARYVQQFNGSDLPPSGSPLFQKLTQIMGWKLAKRLQNLAYRYGYPRLITSRY